MKTLLLAAAFAALAGSAQAGIITYTWHQTSTTKPGLTFSAYYQVIQGAAPHYADSYQDPADFGGLVGLYIEGGGYPAITLSDLVPSCFDGGGCIIGGVFHDFGSPSWRIDLPYYFFYLQATELSADPWHFEWNYILSADSITLGDDNADAGCYNQYDCYTTGYWTTDFVPEPATLPAVLGGLALLSLAWFRRRPL